MKQMPTLTPRFKAMRLKHSISFFLLLFFLPSVFSQADSLQFLLKKVQLKSPVNMRELVYVQTDKIAYLPGDTVYMAAYVLDRLSHKLNSQANTLWGVILDKDNVPVLTERLLIVNGKARGQFVFPSDMERGIYQLTAFTNWQKNVGKEGVFTSRIEVKDLKTPVIRWGIDDLESEYFKGDTVSIKAVLTNGPYEPVVKQRFQATLGDEKVKVVSNEEGKAQITFVVTDSLNKNNTVHFSGYMAASDGADFFEETYSLPLPVKTKKVDIQFMPESGYLVAGIPCKIGFKALDSEGNPVEINGLIEDDKGNMVTVAQSMHNGMGYLNMIPVKGVTYTFRSFNDSHDFGSVKFPKVQDVGVVLKYASTKNNIAYFKLLHNFPEDIKGTMNVNHSGFSYNIASGNFINGTNIEVPIGDFPAGIMRITLFDNNQLPVAERLLFVNAHKKLEVEHWQNHRFLRTRNQSELNLTFKDNEGVPVKAHLSVSVRDSAYGSSTYVNETSIYSSLLLNAELKGNIHNPDFYFEGKRKAPYLDLLMITHGWRRFVWYETLRKNDNLTKNMLNHDLVQGQVMKRDEPVLDGEVTFLSLSTVEPQTVKVNKEGKFWFKPEYPTYFMPDLMLKAKSKKYKERVELVLAPNDSLKNAEMFAIGLGGLAWQSNQVNIDKATQALSPESNYQLGDIKLLDMVNVSGEDRSEFENSPKDFFATSRSYYKTYKDIDFMTDLGSVLEQVAPGLMMDYSSGTASFLNGGYGSNNSDAGVLLVVDDFPRGKIISDYDYLTLDDILDITILKGNEGFYIYGEAASEGVIIIRTRINTAPKNYQSVYEKKNAAVLPSYCADREFYNPKYDTPEKKSDPMPNLLTTIYWDNALETNENGEVEIKWYNGDLRGTKIISIQAVGENGQLGSFTRSYYLR